MHHRPVLNPQIGGGTLKLEESASYEPREEKYIIVSKKIWKHYCKNNLHGVRAVNLSACALIAQFDGHASLGNMEHAAL